MSVCHGWPQTKWRILACFSMAVSAETSSDEKGIIFALPPPPTTIGPSPRPLASVALWIASLSSWSDQRRISGCGNDGCLLGRIHFPVAMSWYVLLCSWGIFPVLTLYSPRSIFWGLFFSPHFLMLSCIFLQFYLQFTTDYTLYDCVCWRIIKNLNLDYLMISKYILPKAAVCPQV